VRQASNQPRQCLCNVEQHVHADCTAAVQSVLSTAS
jgi:hypothetical protein